MAKNYIDNLSEETRKGLDQKAEEGTPPGRIPLGYRTAPGSDGRKSIEPDPNYAGLVRKLFEWYASGNYSLDQVAEMARCAGFVYRKSKRPVSRAALHAILTNRIYTGAFDWNGKTYPGKYQPLISTELWNKVQSILRSRAQKKPRFVKHDFAFARLINCGHCGCALVGETKKGRYTYYHCTGFKGKCPEPFTREEVLEQCFTDILRGLALDEEVVELVGKALKQSHQDVKRFHDESMGRLQAEYTKIQNRIDAMSTDKLDGVISAGFYERKIADWRKDQQDLLREINRHQQSNQTYLDEGIRLLELAQRLPELFAKQEPREKRRLLDFVLSNCTWANGKLTVAFRQPFDLLAVTNEALRRDRTTQKGSIATRLEKLGN
jgi:site-specific DNA recombinase